jgi:hypothetical protein
MIITLQSLQQTLIVEKRPFQVKDCPLRKRYWAKENNFEDLKFSFWGMFTAWQTD